MISNLPGGDFVKTTANAYQITGIHAFVAEDGQPGFRFQPAEGEAISVVFHPRTMPALRALVGALEAMVSAGKTGFVY